MAPSVEGPENDDAGTERRQLRPEWQPIGGAPRDLPVAPPQEGLRRTTPSKPNEQSGAPARNKAATPAALVTAEILPGAHRAH